MAELGFLGAPVPEQYGGSGMDYISFALLCEELERADTAFRVVQSVHVGLNSLTLLQWGTEEQRQRWLVPQARGEKLATFALTEPGAGTDAGNLQTTARRDGDSYVLNGHEALDQPGRRRGPLPRVRDRGPGEEAPGRHGLHPRARNGGPLDRHAPRQARDPCRQHRHPVDFDDVRVPVENRIGEEGEGFLIAMSAIDQGRYTVAAGAVGLAQACLDASLRYAHERQTFGEEIGRHQLVKQMLATHGPRASTSVACSSGARAG